MCTFKGLNYFQRSFSLKNYDPPHQLCAVSCFSQKCPLCSIKKMPDHTVLSMYVHLGILFVCVNRTRIWTTGKLKRAGLTVFLKTNFLPFSAVLKVSRNQICSQQEWDWNYMLNDKNDHSNSNMNWSESMPFVKSKLAGSIQEDRVNGDKHEYWASISEWISLF